MRRLPPLAAVRVFEAAARHLNFTAAAAELGMTQAAVSYQIRVLEERLGLALFHREKKRVTLTEAGRLAGPLVAQAFDTIDDAFSIARRQSEDVLTISSGQTFASNWLAPRLGEFQVGHPDMAVRVQSTHALVDFAREEVDVAIRSGAGCWAGLRCHFLFRQHFLPMCSPAFRARHGALGSPEALLRVPLISPEQAWWRHWFAHAVPDVRHVPGRAGLGLEVQADEGKAAMADQGVALLTPLFWRRELREGWLVPLAETPAYDDTSYYLVYPERHAATPKVRRLREWLLAAIAHEAAGAPFVPPPA
ncbi:LysR substrate-binding domain-containing protein [Sphingomonas profundi]|uniref:LysR substrate-binding domain-containing protein n=1 Tax=Alterirhizorhabdus profundi TaxID=2681549 RepID=UPI0012E797D9|nr:LysR substrate-binding domain-containing protein [Sphingomonas profundi]